MSGIYIPNMEMPQVCGECPFSVHDDDDDDIPTWCGRTNFDVWDGNVEYYDKPPKYCDLFPVPEHGRLIDENDALEAVKQGAPTTLDVDALSRVLFDCPTIIPASGGKDNE